MIYQQILMKISNTKRSRGRCDRYLQQRYRYLPNRCISPISFPRKCRTRKCRTRKCRTSKCRTSKCRTSKCRVSKCTLRWDLISFLSLRPSKCRFRSLRHSRCIPVPGAGRAAWCHSILVPVVRLTVLLHTRTVHCRHHHHLHPAFQISLAFQINPALLK